MWRCEYLGNRILVTWRGFEKGEYSLLEEPFCHKCACPGTTTEECSWHWDAYGYNRIYAMGAYIKREVLREREEQDLLSNHIVGLKMYPGYAVPLGLGLVECLENRYSELLDTDFLAPIPLFSTELKTARRPIGVEYNQSLKLSEAVSFSIGIPTIDILRKTRGQKMKGLTRLERREAVDGLYEVVDEATVRGKRILLIDDVSTSGATASECAKVLAEAGAEVVNVLVAGRNMDTSV